MPYLSSWRCCALALSTLLAACSSVTYRPDIGAAVDGVEVGRLRRHVDDLHRLGPRPVSDAAATRATVDHLAEQLRGWGYEVSEEPVTVRLSGAMYAEVRPVDAPDAEPREILVAPDLAAAGAQAMRAQTARLRAEGWVVEGYSMRAADEAHVFEVPNLIATRRGEVDPDAILELSAHYDTVPNTSGADDNSSGVAALLEVARMIATVRTEKTVRLCFFGAEEVGKLGSEAHVAALGDEAAALVGLINLDAVGFTAGGPDTQREPEGVPWYLSFPDEADFVVVVGSWSSGWLGNVVEAAIDVYAPELPYYSANRIGAWFRDGLRSDHAHYWEAGVPAVWLSDTAEFRSAHYHSPTDTPETLDLAFLHRVTRATLAAALHLAGVCAEPDA